MKTTIIGFGNVGKKIKEVLNENNISVDFVVGKDAIYDGPNSKIDENKNFSKYINEESIVFISLPSVGQGESVSKYYLESLKKGASIVTCEKAFLANNWETLIKYKNKIRYTATVGGDSGILNAISEYKGKIREIKAVVNGTLNYIGNRILAGESKEKIFREVIDKKFAEPGSSTFEEVIENELNDVSYKSAILGNQSGLYKEILRPKDIPIEKYKDGFFCAVVLDSGGAKAGYVTSDCKWFPEGVNNVLYINGKKIIEGPGAGGRITAERMFKDLKTFSAV